MSKAFYYTGGAFLILIIAVLVSCSSFDVKLEQVDGNKLHRKNKNHQQRKHQHNKNQNQNDEFKFFDASGNPKPEAIKQELFGGGGDNNNNNNNKKHHHLHNTNKKHFNINHNKKHQSSPTFGSDLALDNNMFNSSSGFPLGIAVTFSPNFFKNMFNVVIMPEVRKLVQSIHVGGESFGVPGPGGQGSISNVQIEQFDIRIGELVATAPNQFVWSLTDIELEISLQWSVKWELKLCPCFGGCCFHITLFHCSGPFTVNTNNMEITGTMLFSYDEATSTVQVNAPQDAQFKNVPTISISAKCGWFWDAILSVLKFFGLNVWKDVQDAINKAITSGFAKNQGLLGNAMNTFLDKTLNAALNGLKICGFQFYANENFMSVFTRDSEQVCLNSILPPTWLQTAPNADITILGRIALWPTFIPPKTWKLNCLPLPPQWFTLPKGLSSLMAIDEVIVCRGLDSNLGVYVVGEVDIKFFPPTGDQIDKAIAPYLKVAQKQLQIAEATTDAAFQQHVQQVSGEYKEKFDGPSCPFEGGISHMLYSKNGHKDESQIPWWGCANIPLLEKVLSWVPIFLSVFLVVAFVYVKKQSVSEMVQKDQQEEQVAMKQKNVVEF